VEIDERVSLKTVFFTEQDIAQAGREVRFGASDGVAIEAIHYNFETISRGTALIFCALSHNPEHLLAPPATLDEWWESEALYGRWTVISNVIPGSTDGLVNLQATKVIPQYRRIVPSRQVAVLYQILTSTLSRVQMEIYYHEVAMSRIEADLMNITYGKYRR